MTTTEDKFISYGPHHKKSAKYGRESGVINHYEVWECPDGVKYVKMKVDKNGALYRTLFDFEDLDLIKNDDNEWFLTEEQFVICPDTGVYLHDLVMNHSPYGNEVVEHINQNRLDNRKHNLRLVKREDYKPAAIPEIPKINTKRNKIAIDKVDIKRLPRYVEFIHNRKGDYFVIAGHPIQTEGIYINGKGIYTFVPSSKAFWMDKYDRDKGLYPLVSKFSEIVAKLNKLNDIYDLTKKYNTRDISVEVDPIIKDIMISTDITKVGAPQRVYKYDFDENLVDVYGSSKDAAIVNGIHNHRLTNCKKNHESYGEYYYRNELIPTNLVEEWE